REVSFCRLTQAKRFSQSFSEGWIEQSKRLRSCDRARASTGESGDSRISIPLKDGRLPDQLPQPGQFPGGPIQGCRESLPLSWRKLEISLVGQRALGALRGAFQDKRTDADSGLCRRPAD